MSIAKKPYKGLALEGAFATWYGKEVSRNRGFEAIAAVVAARLPDRGAVLEVAPGPGYLAIELARLGAGRVAGVDISRSFVQIARENALKAGVEVEFTQGDAAHLPFPDNSFDQVVCTAAFKNFTHPVGALDEMHRVLRPGGEAAVYDMCFETTRGAIRKEVDGMGLTPWNALFTRLALNYLRRFHAFPQERVRAMAAVSRFAGGRISIEGIGYELRLVKHP